LIFKDYQKKVTVRPCCTEWADAIINNQVKY